MVHNIVEELATLRSQLAAANQRIAGLQAVIEADRTRIIDGVNALEKALNGRFWLTEGRGSYEWNDDRYRQEFGDAARAVLKAVEPLRKIGADLTNCPPTTDEVLKARVDKDKRIAELERDVARKDRTIIALEELRKQKEQG